jgi:hypothetical protein
MNTLDFWSIQMDWALAACQCVEEQREFEFFV